MESVVSHKIKFFRVVGVTSRKKKCFLEGGVCRTMDAEADDVKSFTNDLSVVKQE